MAMKTIAEIISQSRRAAGLNQSELARQLGITPQSVQAWESGRAKPRPKIFQKIAEVLQIDSRFLIDSVLLEPFGDTGFLTPSSNVPVDELAELDRYNETIGKQTFDRDAVALRYLQEVVKNETTGETSVEDIDWRTFTFSRAALDKAGVLPRYARCIDVKGNSMKPLLQDGSVACIDTKDVAVADGLVYALDHAGQLRLRIVFRLPGGGLRLRCFNRVDFLDEEFDQGEVSEQKIKILGKVFWSSLFW
ncbi:helix-turn-helix domain-containing protein [Pseudomonas sp. 10B1]|uniref:XRE family transcriptional regulator n=1 Tax=unclassified Pseudomonas TaxID=196821 RepID=UPI002B22D656|nr:MULTISPECIES: helix-turn-helix domain-containing protein [unclassified Pseudomonas]MEA9994294.1 helix-turn-helix domain-containing protein [Pseudomonas sp. AA4]MEB0088529.1 helix-turn-helix domain-containing protein [Pseudomonas sp. RTI1]MEB0126548.1 helix-turn-helix domain-containing protein [Pseudomonas sp. CCC1.2]MEB0154639.1 helix-turn-helix domain-containing protein [Pseudomonas sp. CCC4.3]MEB0221144.1 helix-turn-helix domain-containing protein [Pseudomonas sp. AB12(2023)]